jgi:hypothetical protein
MSDDDDNPYCSPATPPRQGNRWASLMWHVGGLLLYIISIYPFLMAAVVVKDRLSRPHLYPLGESLKIVAVTVATGSLFIWLGRRCRRNVSIQEEVPPSTG